jgi:lipid A 4'-phosphatase
MARAVVLFLLLVGIAGGLVFAVDPALDLQAAAFFHDAVARPEWRPVLSAIALLRSLEPLVTFAAAAPAVLALATKILRPRWPTPLSSRAALFVIAALAIGPGILVNGVLKEHWGRPRPGEVTEFGGNFGFVPWWDPRGACHSNCSFVSGETSSAVWLMAPASRAPASWRPLALGAALIYAVAIGFMRLLAGGHFPSDVMFAGVFTGLVIWAVHGFLYRWPATRLEEGTVDAFLERIGNIVVRYIGCKAATPLAERPIETASDRDR